MTDTTVLDASAVLAWVDGHPGAASVVAPRLAGALLSAVNGGEVRYKLSERGHDADALFSDLAALGVEVVPFDDAQASRLPGLRALDRAARQASRREGRMGRLSLADLCCLALAIGRDAAAVTGEAHWSRLIEHGLTVPVIDYRVVR